MDYTEIFGTPENVNEKLAILTAEGWTPVFKSAAAWGLMGSQLSPMLAQVLLRRAKQD
jgi:hypothetical protein